MSTTYQGTIRIERVTEQLEIWLDAAFPFAKMKVKVIERGENDYLAIANLLFRNSESGETETEAGLGDTPQEALRDFLERFWLNAQDRFGSSEFAEDGFAWAAPEDF